ncbi:proteasome subunit beta type-4, putative [Plasmodium vivax]|uniref:Proteasome subunit beta n=6 Tax=Plasmodium vivax TaxID=5855 RepID=A5KCH8_PLAVS|nr:proteasome beta-subunit type 4, putative [Plasmodium vivax]KMZ83008.1 proteasome beta-subunit type 4 [Plasmodium vivax India VII]KMZ89546.1 proteasome beta-subunit type 4 [Plasmodium vivax Brazil I]KMZ95908.1 proteasome beta-subunit type 4 [Plasmodium vivax Mauritania I]KNA02431.1 proteasome beta-subunit type 4 [Plasmodium vivax North Korean]EDL42919.1 proteasome beta-subunit type 4, putative [Plasmodium vivax]|eukprot:XP_001608581.1 proteasome beta-subunit type 4 [Plasmodium vivax Sal-1]
MTLGPVVTGTSVIALKYKHGILIAADKKASYGSYAKFQNVERIFKVNNKTVMSFSGELADAQYLHETLTRVNVNNVMDKKSKYDLHNSKYYHAYVGRLFYNRKNKIDPLFNTIIVAGLNSQEYDDNDKDVLLYTGKHTTDEYKEINKEDLYIGFVDMHGTQFAGDYMTTGYARYFALTLLRERYKDYMTEEEAKTLLNECLRVLFYRDATASNKIQIVKITSKGVEYEEPYFLSCDVNSRDYVYPSIMLPSTGCMW